MGNFVIANLVAKLIADTSGFTLRDATEQTQEFEKEAEKAQESTKNLDKDFQELQKGIVAGAAAIGAAAAAMKVAFDLSEEGAQIKQTGESFNLLISNVGASVDLLDQLKSASNGTISEMDLMSATMTLLAGTSGDFATALANATPELMEIAKAANKLNPTLGDTAYMYESIATGIKRSSPLILDNLGLTIKLGDANEAMAEQLGKTVTELTAEEKQMALLNATLAAGDTLIQQVGGSTESAADEWAQFRVELEETTDAWKVYLAEALGPAVERQNDMREIQELLTQALKDGVITQEEYNKALYDAKAPGADLKAIIEGLSQALQDAKFDTEGADAAMLQLASSMGMVETKAAGILPGYQHWSEIVSASIPPTTNAASATDGLAGALGGVAGNASSAKSAIEDLNATTLDLSGNVPNLVGEVQNLDAELDFAEAGGYDLQAAIDAIAALDVDPQVKHDMLDQALIAATALEVSLGNITAEEGAQMLFEELDLTSLEEAQALLGTGPDNLVDLIDKVQDLATLNLDSTQVQEALGLTENQIALMEQLDGMHAEVTVHTTYTQSGNPPSTGTTGGSMGGSDTKPQTDALGGYVFEGTPYLVGEQGPEVFVAPRGGEIIPNYALGRGMGPQVQISNYNTYNVNNPAAMNAVRAQSEAYLIMDLRSVL